MRKVPYVGNAGSACALACYTMAAQYLLPGQSITFEELAKVSDWKKDYVVWGFRPWKYLMDKGIHIVDYDTIDYAAWSKSGVQGLRHSVSKEDFKYYEENTFDLAEESQYIKLAFEHPSFSYIKRRPNWDDVVNEFNKPGIIDLTLDVAKLHNKPGVEIHRVVIVDIRIDKVIFNDPDNNWLGENKVDQLDHFKKLFESTGAPELARYFLDY
jgi:hypothetical protein